MSPSSRLWAPNHAKYVRIFAAAATLAQVSTLWSQVCKIVAFALPPTAGPPGSHILPSRDRLRTGMADLGAVRNTYTYGPRARRVGDPPSPSVRNIPARSPSVAIADQARSHGSGSYQVGAHDPVAGGQDSTAVAALTAGGVDAHGQRRVTLISAPDRKRGPVLYDDPGDPHGAVAGQTTARSPRGPCLWRAVVSYRSRRDVELATDLPAHAVTTSEDTGRTRRCRRAYSFTRSITRRAGYRAGQVEHLIAFQLMVGGGFRACRVHWQGSGEDQRAYGDD